MLNNDFNVLVQKYKQYKKHKSKKRNRRILLLIMIGALAYYISTLNFKAPSDVVQKDESKTVKKIEETDTISTQELLEKAPQKEEENLSKEVVPKKKVKRVKKSGLKVTTKEKSLYQLLENQAQSKSYSSTIAVANFHYSKKEYQKAVKWAIEASKKNKSKERPWIVYAKSKKALGKEDIAKKALTLFLKRNQSQEVQELLNSL